MVLESSRRPEEATGAQYIAARKGCVIKVAKDNVGLISDTSKLTINVRLGAPVIDSITPVTVWVRDAMQYRVFARDTNGVLDSFRISFDMGATWQAADSAKFKSAWDTTKAGVQKIIARVMDDDSVWTSDTFNVTVRLGRPWVRASNDTLYIPSTDGKVGIKLSSYDTNGTIAYYKWDRGADGSIEATTATDSIYYDLVVLNALSQWAVYIKDDDSITNADTFWVYPDAPPPATVINAPQFDSVVNTGTNVNLRWKKDDVHDKKSTQYEIVLWGGSPVDTTRIPWTSGTTYFTNNDGTDNNYAYLFTPNYPATRVVFWRVDAKDARGSFTKGGQSQFFYLKP